MRLIMNAEFRRFKKKLLTQPLSLLPIIVFLYVFFWIITLSAKYISMPSQDMNLLIVHNMIGYIIWFFTISAISAIPQKLVEEKSIGTYEHLNMSSERIESILVARAIIDSLYNIIFIFLFSLLIRLFHGIKLLKYGYSFLVFLITIPGLYGFAFIIAGLLVQSKQSGSWLGVFNLIIILPLILQEQLIPEKLKSILSYWPTYQSSKILRILNLTDTSFYGLKMEIIKLLLSSFAFFIVGLIVFNFANKYARKKGTIGHY